MSNASAESGPSLRAEVQPTSGRLGDLITLIVETRYASDLTVNLPVFQKELGDFEVFASTALPPQAAGPMQTQRFEIQLQSFATGQQLLPPIGFTYTGKDGKPGLLKTPEMKVLIEQVPPGPNDKGGDIRGIKGVIGPVGISPLWWWLLAFALAVGAAALWSQRRKAIQGPPPPPPVPPDITALKKLGELLTSGMVETGRLKEFYSGVSDAVRAYIEQGFLIPALERTTGELLRDLRKRSLWGSVPAIHLKTLLEDCDLVKFAKFRPEADEALKTHAAAVKFVEQTRGHLKNQNALR